MTNLISAYEFNSKASRSVSYCHACQSTEQYSQEGWVDEGESHCTEKRI